MFRLQVPTNRKRGVHARKRVGWWNHLIELVWPSMGWKALLRLAMLKLAKSSADPHRVALGASIGMAVNFLPVPGLGALVAIGAAWLLRANLAAAWLVQTLGNPWTFAPIWWLCYKTGQLMLGIDRTTGAFKALIHNFNFTYINDNAGALMHGVLLPMMVGGTVWGGLLGILTYKLVFWEMQRLMEKRQVRRVAGKVRQHG